MAEFEAQRLMMVDTQIRPSDVTKFPIIEAMLTVPREAFVPDERTQTSYADGDVPLGAGRVLLEPRCFAKLVDALDIGQGSLVLTVGAGGGYGVAVLARLAEAIVGLECDAGLAEDAETALAEAGVDNAVIVQGPLEAGAPKHGPYDVILVEGGVGDIPQTLIDQLKDGGQIGAIFMDGPLGTVRVGHKSSGSVSWRFAFNATAPILPGFETARDFAL